jgi:hypothetical protein
VGGCGRGVLRAIGHPSMHEDASSIAYLCPKLSSVCRPSFFARCADTLRTDGVNEVQFDQLASQ